jgi:hypothetical protein
LDVSCVVSSAVGVDVAATDADAVEVAVTESESPLLGVRGMSS